MIRGLTVAAVVLAGLYGGYWFVAASAAERGANAAVAALDARGWDVAHDGIRVAGFPSRIDTTVTAPRLADPATGLGWEASSFAVFALSYRPNEVIASWPREQVVTVPGDRIAVTSDSMQASAAVAAAGDLPLDSVTFDAMAVQAAADSGWSAAADRVLAAFRRAGPGPADYDLFVEATGLTLPAPLVAALDPQGRLGAAAEVLRADVAVTLDQPLNRHMTGAAATAITLRSAHLAWAGTDITATGTLTAGDGGLAEGRITVNVQDWRRLLEVAADTGAIAPGRLAMAEGALAAIADPATGILSMPLTLANGQMSLGPLPLGAAPRMPSF